MKLTDSEIKAAKPREKQFTIADGGGLQTLVKPNGKKLWQMRYKFAGKEKVLSFGEYPTITLKMARDKREEAKRQISDGIDPMEHKKQKAIDARLAKTNKFKDISEAYIASKVKGRDGKAPIKKATEAKQYYFANKLYPKLGNRPIAEITKEEIKEALKDLEKGLAEGETFKSAKRVCIFVNEVFNYAIDEKYCQFNPALNLTKTIAAPKVRHMAAITDDSKKFAKLIADIYQYQGGIVARNALKFLAHTFLRTGEMRTLEWHEIDFEAKVLTLPAQKTKMKREFTIPLSSQVIEVLESMKPHTGKLKYVFHSPAAKDGRMSENTINQALRRMGYDKETMCGHGFRSSASSFLNESGLWQKDAIERSLAHIEPNEVIRAYNRTDYWKQRVAMMQWWSDQLSMAVWDSGYLAEGHTKAP